MVPQDSNPPLKRGIHPLHLIFLIGCAALAFPLAVYLVLMLAFLLMPGSMD
jgi:hypothetical protein